MCKLSQLVPSEIPRVHKRKLHDTLSMANDTSSDLLQRQQIPDLPPKMFYIPNIITEDEEQRILEKVKPTICTVISLVCLL
jgi:hypothetical protein